MCTAHCPSFLRRLSLLWLFTWFLWINYWSNLYQEHTKCQGGTHLILAFCFHSISFYSFPSTGIAWIQWISLRPAEDQVTLCIVHWSHIVTSPLLKWNSDCHNKFEGRACSILAVYGFHTYRCQWLFPPGLLGSSNPRKQCQRPLWFPLLFQLVILYYGCTIFRLRTFFSMYLFNFLFYTGV